MSSSKSSTFPGIWKYPSDRVTPFKTPVEWLDGKKEDDDIGQFWRVHDKLYDVTTFITSHPGGSEWLEMTQGLDITEAFESHHVLNQKQVKQTLEKYYVQDASSQRNSPYTFKNDGFYQTLKESVESILKDIGTGSTTKILLMQDGLVVLFIILSIFGVWTKSWTLNILAGVILTMVANGAHNFIHMKENWRKNYMDFSLLSSYDWRITHILSHHLYPNTVLDSEMSLAEPMFDFKTSNEKSWKQRYLSMIYALPFFIVLLWIPYFSRWRNIIHRKQICRPQEIIVVVEFIVLYIFADHFTHAVMSWIIIHTACSFYFGLFSFTVAHHHPSIWHDGDEARPEPDFGLCQLDAVRERSDSIYDNLFIVLTRYGEHSLHHLFPSICHSKLPHLKPALLKTLENFKEELLAFPEWELFVGAFKQLQKTDPSPFFKLSKKIEAEKKNLKKY